jgi:glycosyltransferase involved in cell wall biosynthesis
MDARLVTVVVPAHNAERYLTEAIDSVLAQAHRPLEIIVVDDGSTDHSAELARSFGSPVAVLTQPQQGAATARNRGVDAAHGEYLAFLDADDVWSADKLALQLAALEAHPDWPAVFGQVEQFISPELDEDTQRQIVCPPGPRAGLHVGAMLIRRADFQTVGPFDPHYALGEFVDWCARAAERGLAFQVLPQVVMRRRLHTTNLTRRQRDDQGAYVRLAKAALDRRRAHLKDK